MTNTSHPQPWRTLEIKQGWYPSKVSEMSAKPFQPHSGLMLLSSMGLPLSAQDRTLLLTIKIIELVSGVIFFNDIFPTYSRPSHQPKVTRSGHMHSMGLQFSPLFNWIAGQSEFKIVVLMLGVKIVVFMLGSGVPRSKERKHILLLRGRMETHCGRFRVIAHKAVLRENPPAPLTQVSFSLSLNF